MKTIFVVKIFVQREKTTTLMKCLPPHPPVLNKTEDMIRLVVVF